jgi:hypothetical protein
MQAENVKSWIPYLHDPLVLIGFFLFLAFLFTRYLLKSKIIPPLPPGLGYSVLRAILLYGFIIGILLIVFGFGLKYQELRAEERRQAAERRLHEIQIKTQEREAENDRAERERRVAEAKQKAKTEQDNTVSLLRGELASNLRTTNELRKNAITILSMVSSLATATRIPGIKIMPVLFSEENLRTGVTVSAAELADRAMEHLVAQQLNTDDLENQKFAAAAKSIAGTIDRTIATVRSLSDPGGKRYPVKTEVWDAHQVMIRDIGSVRVGDFQKTYTAVRSVRANYEISIERAIDYMEALHEFLAPPDKVINRQRLAKVLAAERLAIQIISTYAAQLADSIAEVHNLQKSLLLVHTTALIAPRFTATHHVGPDGRNGAYGRRSEQRRCR